MTWAASTRILSCGPAASSPSLHTMTVQTVNVSTLKRVKNNVIGNLSAKSLLPRMSFCRHPCQSPQCTRSIRGCCGTTGQYPCRGCPCHHLPILWLPTSTPHLLHANAHQAFLYAISRFDPSEPTATKTEEPVLRNTVPLNIQHANMVPSPHRNSAIS